MPILPSNPWFLAVDQMWDTEESTTYQMGGNRTYPVKFMVRLRDTAAFFSPTAVANAPYIPIGGALYITPYTHDVLAVCREKKAKRLVENDWRTWIVTCTFSTDIQGRAQDPQTDDHPELEKPEIEWDFETVKMSPLFDLNGKALLNSANMPFSPPPTFDIGIPVLRITRNELSFNATLAQTFAYALNDARFLGYPAGTVQCMPPKAKQKWKGNKRFWSVSYALRFAPYIPNPDFETDIPEDPVLNPESIFYPWQPKLLDQGMYRLDQNPGSPTFLRQIPIVLGLAFVHHPVLLDGFGQVAVGFPLPTDPPRPAYIDFVLYQDADFTSLLVEGLGGNFSPF